MFRTTTDLQAHQPFQDWLQETYGDDAGILAAQTRRFSLLAARIAEAGHPEVAFFSTPARAELAGNHTDHSQGRVLAAAIDRDAVAAVAPRQDRRVRFTFGGQSTVEFSLDDLGARREERGVLVALIRGVAARLKALGHAIGGFEAFVGTEAMPDSEVLTSGIREALTVTIFNELFNGGRLSVTEQALVGQFAENRYFGRPCGLMDQITCATGGVVAIDFADPARPDIQQLDLDFSGTGMRLCMVDTGRSGPELAQDYATIAWEMKMVAAAMGKEACRFLDRATLMEHIPQLRPITGDRAILRTLHFLEEDARVEAQARALREGDFPRFLELVRESSLSSFRWLQNIVSPGHPQDQSVTLALALADDVLATHGGGACRIHGAGFAGTIQAWVREEALDAFRAALEPVFGQGSVIPVHIRRAGSVMAPDRA
jgi:galactokinase